MYIGLQDTSAVGSLLYLTLLLALCFISLRCWLSVLSHSDVGSLLYLTLLLALLYITLLYRAPGRPCCWLREVAIQVLSARCWPEKQIIQSRARCTMLVCRNCCSTRVASITGHCALLSADCDSCALILADCVLLFWVVLLHLASSCGLRGREPLLTHDWLSS